MRSLFNYIIETENRYNNKIDIDGVELVVNTEITQRDAIFVNRIGRIIHTPVAGSNHLPVGAEVIVHHNVFRRWIGTDGKEKNSGSYLEEDKYLVYEDQIFGYNEGNGWKACKGFCFVEPDENKDTWINGHEALLVGTMKYPDESLQSQGIKEGDLVGFTPNSEYEFTIEGKKLFRILSNQINILYGHQEDATEAPGCA